MIENIHPHEVMVDFVNKYDAFIKPNLEKGNLNSVRHIIGDVVMRASIYFEDFSIIPLAKRGAYAKYRIAITNLASLTRAENVDNKLLEYTLDCADRYVEDLDLMLHDDPKYKEYREKLK